MITHDIRAALQIADRVSVFYDGETVETALPEDFQNDGCGLKHPYSRKLIQALPRLRSSSLSDTDTMMEKEVSAGQTMDSLPNPKKNSTEPLIRLRAEDIHFQYQNGKKVLTGVNFEVRSDEVVGLVAPSGAGKTTFARVLAGYRKPSVQMKWSDWLPQAVPGKQHLPEYWPDTGNRSMERFSLSSMRKRPTAGFNSGK